MLSGKGKSQVMEGWFQRSLPGQQGDGEQEDDEDDEDEEEEAQGEAVQVDYKEQYKRLKRKLKYLIYENECYQENLRASRAKLLEIARDRSFLLDRLLQYEKVEVSSSSDSGEETESSDGEGEIRQDNAKRKKVESSSSHHSHLHLAGSSSAPSKNPTPAKKKKPPVKSAGKQSQLAHAQGGNSVSHSAAIPTAVNTSVSFMSDGHMTPEEVERHLSARGHSFMELLPERAPPTVPTEMFSNEPSLDSESNELGDLETSPSNLGEDCLSVDMMAD